MKKLFGVFILIICIGGLTGSSTALKRYEYVFKLIDPAADSLYYEDSVLQIAFAFDEKSLVFGIKNKSNKPLEIVWDETSLVIFGEANKITHAGVRYLDAGKPMSNTLIPPAAYVREMAIPVNNISYNGRDWSIAPMLYYNDYGSKKFKDLILSLKGKEITLFLTLVSESKFSKSFRFRIEEVKCINCK
jgi:hypothetical protein